MAAIRGKEELKLVNNPQKYGLITGQGCGKRLPLSKKGQPVLLISTPYSLKLP